MYKVTEGKIVKREFATYNPLSIFVYFVAVTGMSMSVSSPVIIVLSLIAALFYAGILGGAKAVKTNALISVVTIFFITLINTLFTHRGETVLFYINYNGITAEAITFGVFSGFMFSGILVWFYCFGKVVTGEMIMYLFSGISSFLALLISMILRYIPLLKNRYDEVSMGQFSLNSAEKPGLFKRISMALKKISVLISWSLEASIESADSMAARGYGLKGRTSFHIYKIEKRDIVFMSLIVISTAVSMYILKVFDGEIQFYPLVKFPSYEVIDIAGIILFAAVISIPALLDAVGEIRWKKSELKI